MSTGHNNNNSSNSLTSGQFLATMLSVSHICTSSHPPDPMNDPSNSVSVHFKICMYIHLETNFFENLVIKLEQKKWKVIMETYYTYIKWKKKTQGIMESFLNLTQLVFELHFGFLFLHLEIEARWDSSAIELGQCVAETKRDCYYKILASRSQCFPRGLTTAFPQ